MIHLYLYILVALLLGWGLGYLTSWGLNKQKLTATRKNYQLSRDLYEQAEKLRR